MPHKLRSLTAFACALAFAVVAAACIQPAGGEPDVTEGDDLADAIWADELAVGSGVTALAVGPDGALYAAGWTTEALPAGSGSAGAGRRDAFVRRYSPDGVVVWTRQFGAVGDDNAEDIAIDAAGNVYVAARVDGPVGANAGGRGRDGFVAAYDPGGLELWSLQIGTPEVEWADAVAVTEDGTVFVSGSTTGEFPGQLNRGSTDNFVARITPDGALASIIQFGSEEGMGATALAASGGLLYVAGSTLGPLSSNPTGDEHAGSADIYVRVYDATGAELRTWTFGSNNADTALDLTVDSDGSAVVVGTTRATLPNPVVGVGTRVGGFLDAFAIGLDPQGKIAWVRQFGTDEWDVASSVSPGTDADGVLYIAGRTSGAFPGHSARGEFDIFVRAIDTNGATLWTRQLGSAAEDFAYAVAAGPANSVYVGGSGGLVSGGDSDDERGWVIRIPAPLPGAGE